MEIWAHGNVVVYLLFKCYKPGKNFRAQTALLDPQSWFKDRPTYSFDPISLECTDGLNKLRKLMKKHLFTENSLD